MASWARKACLLSLLCLTALFSESAVDAEPQPTDGKPVLHILTMDEPNDPAYHELLGDLYVEWPAHALGAVAAWEYYPGWYFNAAGRPQDSAIIAVIDTGVDPGHPDFMNPGAESTDVSQGGQLLLSAARSFLSHYPEVSPYDITDEHGHGTHLAGLIAAAANNGDTGGSGIAGLGYPVRLLPIKVARASGAALHADVSEAISYAADQGAVVILIGMTAATWSQALQEAVDYAWDRGCLLIAPSGDVSDSAPSFPAQCPHVFGVGATSASGTLAWYSGVGDKVALVAPGGDDTVGVYSTLPTYACTLRTDLSTPAYGWQFGTGQAAAHAAAAAGLFAGMNRIQPSSGDEGALLWQALQQSAAAVGTSSGGWDSFVGYGMVAPVSLVSSQRTREATVGSIVGRVLNTGSPSLQALVTAYPEDGGPESAAMTVWPAGGYRMPNLAWGYYRVIASTEGNYGTWERVEVLPGCDTPAIDFRLGDPPAEAALLTSGIPQAAVRGQPITLAITFTNTGQSNWRRADGYVLRQMESEQPISITPEQISMIPLVTIAPGEAYTFTFSLAAPDAVGFYTTAWQMCQQGGQGHFGEVAQGVISVTSFLDVRADYWAINEIEAAKAASIVRGYEGYLYHPDWIVSRDQMAVYIARSLAGGDAYIPTAPATPSFPDVTDEHWAYPYVEYIKANQVAFGYDDGLYHPDWPLDRAQMAVFIARAIATPTGDGGVPDPLCTDPIFPDIECDFWARKYIQFIKDHNITHGYPDGLYHPEYPCSRDQMAVYVARAFGLSQ